jgi:hypothetical protein
MKPQFRLSYIIIFFTEPFMGKYLHHVYFHFIEIR